LNGLYKGHVFSLNEVRSSNSNRYWRQWG